MAEEHVDRSWITDISRSRGGCIKVIRGVCCGMSVDYGEEYCPRCKALESNK